MSGASLRLLTYNVHQWVGTDGRNDPIRVMQVIACLDADVVALQEMSLPCTDVCTPPDEFLQEHTGMHVALGVTMRRHDAHFGNALLSRLPFAFLQTHDISFPGREPRGVIEAVVENQGCTIQLLATHLGLRSGERRRQVKRILELAAPDSHDVVALLGDCNEWFPRSRTLGMLRNVFGREQAPRTFPARYPFFALDRIMALPQGTLADISAHQNGAAGSSSDHLPLSATLHLP